jgi:hypothetical protein
MFQCSFIGWFPKVALQVDPEFDNLDSFAFQKFPLQGGVWFADQNLPALAQHAMPRDAFPGRRSGHSAACGACSTGQAQ